MVVCKNTTRINQLEQSRLVKRRADPTNRRGVVVNLTAKRRKLIDRAIEARLKSADSAITDMSTKEQSVEDNLRALSSTHN